MPNATLKAQSMNVQKGFPQTYDQANLFSAISMLRSGQSVSIPVYSHAAYDILDKEQEVHAANVIILEGVVALQFPDQLQPDIGIYLDAEPELVFQWYLTRLSELIGAARQRPDQFFYQMRKLTDAQILELATHHWTTTNLPNLEQHIAPSQCHADLIVRKADDHQIVDVQIA